MNEKIKLVATGKWQKENIILGGKRYEGLYTVNIQSVLGCFSKMEEDSRAKREGG